MAIRILSSESITGNLTVNGISQIGASADANLSLGSSGDTFVLTSKKNGTDGIPMIFKVQASGGAIYEGFRIDTSGNSIFAGNVTISQPTNGSDAILSLISKSSSGNSRTSTIEYDADNEYMYFKNAGTTVATMTSGGNVGIGTDSPNYQLEVQTTTNNRGIHVNNSTTSGTNWGLQGGAYGVGATKNIGLQINAEGASTNYAALFTGGNIGIGTVTPQKKVHIEGTGAASEMQILVSSASDTVGHTAGIGLRGEGGEADGDLRIKGGIFFERIAGSFGNGKMILAVNSSVSNTSVTVTDHALTIDTNKNVGIGTTSPDYKLDVSGNIRSSTLTVYDGMGGTETGIGASSAGGNLRLYSAGTNKVTVTNTAQSLILYGNSTTGSNYIQFKDSQGTSQGYLGYGSSGSNVLYLVQQKSDDIQFYSNGSTRMTINTDGNIGIGVSPESGMVSYIKQLRIGEQSGFQGHGDGVGQDSATWVTTNFKFSTSGGQFINGTAAAPGYAMQYQQQVGDHSFGCSTAAGVAGGAITMKTQLTLKQNGNVLKPNSCAFSASTTAPGFSVTTTDSKITYNTENVDTNGNYDTTLSRFTAPVTGNYLIGTTNTCYISTVVTQYMAVYIVKNGSGTSYRFRGGGVDNQVNDWFGINGSVIIPLAQDDYIELFGYTNAGSFQIVNTEGHFYGYLIG
jgi:hypothetical protein